MGEGEMVVGVRYDLKIEEANNLRPEGDDNKIYQLTGHIAGSPVNRLLEVEGEGLDLGSPVGKQPEMSPRLTDLVRQVFDEFNQEPGF
jgi:hypothetical protein